MSNKAKRGKKRRPAGRPDGGIGKVTIESGRRSTTMYLTLNPELEDLLLELLQMFACWAEDA